MRLPVYLDANIFIYLVEGEPSFAEPVREFFDFLQKKSFTVTTSELTLAEVLAPPRRPGALPLHIKKRLYLDLILFSSTVELAPVSREILIETTELRNVTKHKLADAIHILSAVRAKCRYFVSNDADAKKALGGMEWVVPNQQGIRTILDTLT